MLRCDSVIKCILRCGSVRFSEMNPTVAVRFGAVFRYDSNLAVRSGAVSEHHQCGANPRRDSRRKPCFPYGALYE